MVGITCLKSMPHLISCCMFLNLEKETQEPHRIVGNQKTFLAIHVRGSKIARNSVGRQMAIENFYDLRSPIVLTFSIAAYPVWGRVFVSSLPKPFDFKSN